MADVDYNYCLSIGLYTLDFSFLSPRTTSVGMPIVETGVQKVAQTKSSPTL